MSETLAVDVVDVSKRFRLYKEKYYSLKERMLHAGRNPFEDFWALREVSFSVEEGETVGILGQNGSGKSTMLKCVSGILQPTEGEVIVRGKLAALLELGAGFQPELSGRDNIYLNASLLGLSTKEVERRFDEIVAFAELEQFVDNQVKYYSSGMYVRLGFAVAVNVDPDVLVVDEVLAVGDENFQRKCLDRIKSFQKDGRSILFVTHSPDLARQICDRALVLASGEMIGMGSAAEAIRVYHSYLLDADRSWEPEETSEEAPPGKPHPAVITAVDLEHPGTGSRDYLLPGEGMTVHVSYEVLEPLDEVVFGIEIRDQRDELVFGVNTELLGKRIEGRLGSGKVDFVIDSVPLLGGPYTVNVASAGSGGIILDLKEHAARFEVMNTGRSVGAVALDVRAEIRTATFS